MYVFTKKVDKLLRRKIRKLLVQKHLAEDDEVDVGLKIPPIQQYGGGKTRMSKAYV